ncbi:hypothetical protein ACUADT_005008 [Enterobacter cloacae]
MPQKTIVNVASYVQELAKENNVTANRDVMSRMAVTITALTVTLLSWIKSSNCW